VHPLNPNVVPTVDDAIALYGQAGGTITKECTFGFDPLANNATLIRQREEKFVRFHMFDEIYNNVVSGNGSFLE
jgi:hypothetical protein